MRVVGLTGGISCGKSTVSSAIESSGVPVIDCDKIAREVVLPGSAGLREIQVAFGDSVLQPDGTLDRKALGAIIFKDAKQRKRLNKILIPKITKSIGWSLLWNFVVGTRLVVIDAPTLYETSGPLLKICHSVIVVATTSERQLKWLTERDGSGEEDAKARIASQMSISDKVKRADRVIWNTATRTEARKKATAIVQELKENLGVSPLFSLPGILIVAVVMYVLAKRLL